LSQKQDFKGSSPFAATNRRKKRGIAVEELRETTYNSITYGKLSETEMFDKIAQLVQLYKDEDFVITVGTDSQTYSRTKVITVVCVHRVGKGGIFFYSSEHLKPINNLRVKIYNETMRSIELARKLTNFLFERELDFSLFVHLDIGRSKQGKTAALISELMGWVIAEGFQPEIKPNSYAASVIADRLSK